MIYFRALVDFAAETVALIAHHMATDSARAIRVCRVEEAANVRTYYALDADDLALWDVEWHEWAAAEQRRGRSDA